MTCCLPRNILVVEDDADFSDNLKDILEEKQFNVKTAGNAEDAIKIIITNQIPVVLLDIKLPGRSGISILREIKEIKPETLVVVMTAFASLETAISALKQDAYSYLIKPINMDELLILLNRAFEEAKNKLEKERLFVELAEANKKMEMQNQEIIEKNRELQERNEELAAFFYTLSHDLKSSVVTFHGYLDFLSDMELSPDVKELIERLRITSIKMSNHIKGLLKMPRSGETDEDKEFVNPGEIAEVILMETPPNLKPPNLRTIIQPNFPSVWYNRKNMEQILENLIGNALKFIGNNPEPLIEAGCLDDKEGKKYIIFLKDNGIGIETEYREKIFQIFHQINEIPNPNGTGVGLSIVRRIVTNNHGKIWVESEKGKGSTFFFTVQKIT